MIVFFYSFDKFNILLEIKFWIIISINFFLITTTLKSFYWFEISSKKHFLIFANWSFFRISMITTIFESKNQSIFRQNFQYWQSHIDIWIIFDFWEFSKIASVCSAIQFNFFNINDKINNISNFKFFIFLFNISIRNQYWNYSSFSKLLRNHICFINKRFCFFRFDVEFNFVLSETTKIFSRNFTFIRYWIYSLCLKIRQNYIQLFNQSTFFSNFCDVFDIFIVFELRFFRFFSKYRFFQFEFVMFWFKNQII